MRRRTLEILALGLVGLAPACAPRPEPQPPPPPQAPTSAGREAPDPPPASPRRPYTIDDRFADLARAVPGGFGGLWLQGDVLHVNLVDLSREAEARAALKERLRGEFGPGAGGQRGRVELDRIVFHQGRYDYVQLTAWYARLPAGLGYEGVITTDIDERRNRIVVGVESAAAAERVRRRVAELGIPAEAVLVERGEPVRIRG